MKYVVAAMVSAMTLTSGNFLKPLNPTLGETLQVRMTSHVSFQARKSSSLLLQVDYDDGSRAFMEQTCHHPPVRLFSSTAIRAHRPPLKYSLIAHNRS